MTGLQKGLLPVVFLMLITIPPVFAQTEEMIQEGIGGIYDELVDPLELPEGNPLNTTEAELEAVKKEGGDLIDAFINLFRQTHDFAKVGIMATSPIEIDSFMVSLIAIGVVAVIVLPILKKMGVDLLKIFIVGIIIVLVFMMVPMIL